MKCIFFEVAFFITVSASVAQTVQPKLEIVAELPVRPGNVAVSKEGRVFATIHPLGSSEIQLIEVKGKTEYRQYPDASFQKNGKPASDAALDTPLGLTFDKNDNLWVIDMGQTIGKTRLWSFDIAKNKLINTIELPLDIAPNGSFIQDVAIDDIHQWAFLADIANPGIIAVDLKTGKARRFSGAAALQSEDIDMVIDGKVTYFGGKPARVAVNPIIISPDRQTLYFGSMNGTKWYSLPVKLFRDNANDLDITAAIKIVGDKPISDGAGIDGKGNHYFTNLPGHAVSKLSTKGKLTDIIKDNRLLWPDNVYYRNGWLYISVNQLNTTPAFTGGKDEGHAPYFIYKFKNPE
ncbi:L-dopachrome tautomerase-related protein [Flavobacterium sp. DG1-102-2]|uniref:L-dopachrome tautomerase-related protein n=1 Tax=Flavobacterium sp. DG1-102-2 TaxID=3081663 RepID=UPI00294A1507|nr:L-dopachrome tautomerase-related protein [Flavobacterium sp. DG1-102-2]MDV6170324.1 L-dopachrome tautomerase-related protein [Flavobacterium sp. DG1-102-2]